MVKSVGKSDTIDMLKRRVDPHGIRAERYAMEERAMTNILYFSGQQHFYITEGRVYDATANVPEHRVLYKVNLVRSSLLRAAAKILNVNAEFKAVPETDSIRHRNIAEISGRVFDHIRDKNDWRDSVHLLGTMWAALCGSGFYKVWWDTQLGEPLRKYKDPNTKQDIAPALLTDEERKLFDQAGEFEDFYTGDVRIDVQSLFSTFWDWTSRDRSVAGCQWMAERHYYDIALVAERFGIDEKDLQPEEMNAGLLQYEEAIAYMANNSGIAPFNYASPQDKRGTRCSYVEMWERPSRAHKKGRRVVAAGGRVLIDGDNPYAGDRTGVAHLPYIKQDWTPHPGRFIGSSLVEDLTNPQHHLNSSRGCMLEFLRVFGRPATYVFEGSGLDGKDQTIDPGGVYVVSRMGKKPEVGATPQLPSEVANIGALCESDLLSLASQSEVEGSKLPGQMRSGAALRTMQEQRDIALTVSSSQAIRAARDVGRGALALGQMFYTRERTVRYLGDDNQWTYVDFSAADLTNDLVVVGQPSIVDTENSRRAEILDSVQAGGLNPRENPEDRELFLAAMQFASPGIAVNARLAARKNQETEITAMIADPTKFVGLDRGTYPVMDWQEHGEEIAVLKVFMYGQTFANLDPITKSVIAAHFAWHNEMQQAAQQKQLELMEAVKGMPAAKGRASMPTA